MGNFLRFQIVTTLIKRCAYATLVSKGDVGGDSPNFARDGVKETRNPDRSKCCSALIQMNWRACYTFLESLWEDASMGSKNARIRVGSQKLWLLKVGSILAASYGVGTWEIRFGRNPLSQIGHAVYHWKVKETNFLEW